MTASAATRSSLATTSDVMGFLETGRSLPTSRTLERIAEATDHELAIDFRPTPGAKE